jgi:hypothetical protein
MAISGSYVSTTTGRCALRVVLWTLTVVAALLPSLIASESSLSFNIPRMAAGTNAKGLFAEFYFVVIVISIFGLGNVAHNGFTSPKRPHVWVAVIGLILVGFYAVVLIEGTGRFGALITLSRQGLIPLGNVKHDINLIMWTMAIGLATEIVIAIRDVQVV